MAEATNRECVSARGPVADNMHPQKSPRNSYSNLVTKNQIEVVPNVDIERRQAYFLELTQRIEKPPQVLVYGNLAEQFIDYLREQKPEYEIVLCNTQDDVESRINDYRNQESFVTICDRLDKKESSAPYRIHADTSTMQLILEDSPPTNQNIEAALKQSYQKTFGSSFIDLYKPNQQPSG